MKRLVAVFGWMGLCAALWAVTAGAGEEGGAKQRDWPGLLQRLGSGDFARREAAQKELGGVERGEFEALKKQVAAAGDEEVKARLQKRVEALEDEMAWNPGPISLKVNNATLGEVRAALGKEMGMRLEEPEGYRSNFEGVGRFTLDINKVSFWQAVMALNKQSPAYPEMRRLLTLRGGDAREGVRGERMVRGEQVGGFMVWAEWAGKERVINLTERDDRKRLGRLQSSAGLIICAAADPRIRLIAVKPLRILLVVDQQGNKVLANDGGSADEYEEPSGQHWSRRVGFDQQAGQTGRTLTVRGEGRFLVGSGIVQTEAADIEKEQQFRVGDELVKMQNLESLEGGTGFRLILEKHGGKRESEPRWPVWARLMDAEGRDVWEGEVASMVFQKLTAVVRRPIRAVFTAPARAVEVRAPFELKGLPVPF